MATRTISLHLSRTGVESVVYGALVHMLGLQTADAIDFYVDTRLATDDPGQYERAIMLLLGRHGGAMVMHGIRSELEASKPDRGQAEKSFGRRPLALAPRQPIRVNLP